MLFLSYCFYYFGIYFFYFYAELVFNFNRLFDNIVPGNSSELYDYIIGKESYYFIDNYSLQKGTNISFLVGTGSAGAVLAENLKGRILVIEAGNGGGFLFNIPILQPLIQRSCYDWRYETVPQQNACFGLKNNISFWPAGKILGGSHAINNMIYHRGHRGDYSNIINDASQSQIEKYFEQNEEMVPVSETKFKSTLADAWIKTGKSFQYYNIFFDYSKLTQKNGRRVTHSMFLPERAPNVDISYNSVVTRVLFDKELPNSVIGVEFEKKGKFYQMYAVKTILSAGTIGSAKILLLSGIGPSEHLNELGIEVIQDLPVGKMLQDHISTGMDLIIIDKPIGLQVKDIINPVNFYNYLFGEVKDNPFSFGGCDAMGFIKKNYSAPILSFMVIPVGLTADYGLHLKNIVNLNDDVWENYFMPLIGQTTASILPVLLSPISNGYVKLRSANYRDPPVINPRYLSDENNEDIALLRIGIRFLKLMINHPELKKLGAKFNSKPLPGCEKLDYDSHLYWDCYIRHMTMSMFHPVGTCGMGEHNNSKTVVEKNFQVKNVKNLYVVDGSVLPYAPSANPHALIAMLARKFIDSQSKNDEVVKKHDRIIKYEL
ncbi:unnamed protein product [Diamesa serratosioi]